MSSSGTMTLRESLVTLIEFARDNGGETDPRIKRAIKRVAEKANRMREQHERRATRHPCHLCGHNCDGLLCWKCWMDLPVDLSSALTGARTAEAKRIATRAIFEYTSAENVSLPCGATATVTADAPPELLEALNTMATLAAAAHRHFSF